MGLSERILLAFSRPPKSEDYIPREEWTLDSALSILNRVFPDFVHLIKDKKILDFGCGTGYQSIALLKSGARHVVGLDTNQKSLGMAREFAKRLAVTEVEFVERLKGHHHDAFDIVISQNSMEHFPDPSGALAHMISALNGHGRLLITFGPPWLAPYGSHMQFFTKLPWVNLLFDETTVMSVRGRFRNDGATRYEEVEAGLNRMTVARFEELITQSGLRVCYKKYECVRDLRFFQTVPFLRELFINHISCVLARAC